MISICMPTYNRINDLKRCLNSIFEGFKDYPYEVIIADGGSTDGTIEYLRKLKNVKLIEQGKLTGSIKAFNECFKIAKGKHIFMSTDDFVLVPSVLIKMSKLLDENPKIGIVSPKMVEAYRNNYPNIGKIYNLIFYKIHMFPAKILKELNGFDENYRTYLIDIDFPLEVLKAGYTIIASRQTGVYHYRSEVGAKKHKEKNKNAEKEQAYFNKKWKKLEDFSKEYIKQNSLKKNKKIFFENMSKIFRFRPIQPLMRKEYRFMTKTYDWLLQKSVVYDAKKYNHLKDFYLAQKLPEEYISNY